MNPIGQNLLSVQKPARYVNHEYGAYSKSWEKATLKWALAFPEIYEIGMSNSGLAILYNILNNVAEILADRVYAPWLDMEDILKTEDVPLWGLETGKPINEFDIIGISISYELTYTNIVSILKLGKVPLYAASRAENDPIVIGGGCGAFNPEPVAPFFDAILIGDGEEAVLEISETIINAKKNNLSRQETLELLSKIEGLYIPLIPKDVKRRIVQDLNTQKIINNKLVSNIQLVHDRVGVEIQRGCTRGCRFCQAGFVYRPVRQKNPEKIITQAKDELKESGYEECAFLSLSSGDYANLTNIILQLDHDLKDNWVHISLPSLRVESLNQEIISSLSRSLKGGFTIAPEAGSERLRRFINKGNTEEDLLGSVQKIFKTGWKNIKLYFMIGLPTETEEDIDAIINLAYKVRDIGRQVHKFPNITVNVSTFVPKSHTPFQRELQISIARTKEIHQRLKDQIKGSGLKLKLHNPEMSFLEGVFSRGGSELSRVIELAYKKGCRFDAWDDHLNFTKWLQAFDELKINSEDYLRKREINETLPWDHLFTDLSKEYLLEERIKADDLTFTLDCSKEKCTGCGICDHEKVKPIVFDKKDATQIQKIEPVDNKKSYTYLINYKKADHLLFVGHIDFSNLFKRLLRRANLPLRFSEGFNPRPHLLFAAPLSVGIESNDEWAEFELTKNIDHNELKLGLRAVLPKGMEIKDVICKKEGDRKLTACVISNIYNVKLSIAAKTMVSEKIREFEKSDNIPVDKRTKRGLKKRNIKDYVISIAEITGDAIEVNLKQGGISIFDVCKWLFDLDEKQTRLVKIIKEKTCLMN